MESAVKNIHDLPIELLQMILSYGSTNDFVSCRQVCSRWNEAIGSLLDSQQKIILKINGKKKYDRTNASMLFSEWRTPFQGIRFKHLGIFGWSCMDSQPQRIVTFPPNILIPIKRLEFIYSMSHHTNIFQIISACQNLQLLKINCPTQDRKTRVKTEPGNYSIILSQLQSVSLTAGTRKEKNFKDEGSPLVAIHSILPTFVEHCKSLKSFELDLKLNSDYASKREVKDIDPITITEAINRLILNNIRTLTHISIKVANLKELHRISGILQKLTILTSSKSTTNLKTFILSCRTGWNSGIDSKDWRWDSTSFIANCCQFFGTQKYLTTLCLPLVKNDTELSTVKKFYQTLGTLHKLSTLTLEGFCKVNLNYLNLCGPALKVLTVNFHNRGIHSFTPFTGEMEAKIQGLEIRLRVMNSFRTQSGHISTLQLFTHLSHLDIHSDDSVSNNFLQQVIKNCVELKSLKVSNMSDVTDFGVTGILDSFSESMEVRRNGLVRDFDVESGRAHGSVSLTNLRDLEILHLESAWGLKDFGIRYGLQFHKLKKIQIKGAQEMTGHGLLILAFQNPTLSHANIDTRVSPGAPERVGGLNSNGLDSFEIDTFYRLLPQMARQNAHIKCSGVH